MMKSFLKTAGLVSAVFVALWTSNSFAANVATSDVTNQAQAKPWHILFDVNHNLAHREDQFATTDITLFFDYQLDKNNSFRILQAPTYNHEIGLNQGENEWMPSETVLFHFWNTGLSTGPFRYRLVSSVGLPTSIEAQDNDKIVTLTETVQINALFYGKFVFSLRPFLRYNWYEFKTTKQGRLLPTLIYGMNLVTSYSINDKLSLNASAGYSEIQESASQFDQDKNLGIFEENAEGRYFLSLSANYSFTDKLGGYVGFSQGDNYIRDGRYEVYAYDAQFSRYNVGMTVYF